MPTDTERLDWLERNGQAMGSAIEMEHGVWLNQEPGESLRSAIDAAMKEAPTRKPDR